MIKQSDILELEIEKIIFEGFALGHKDDKAVFVKGAMEGEIVSIKVDKVHKNYIEATLIEVKKPSNKRIKPECPLNKPCGGCDFAHIEYNEQILIKEKIIKEIFQKFEGLEILPAIKSENPLHYRAKTQYPVQETKNSKRILTGYYKEKTHEIVNIKYCPIQPSVIDEIIDFIRNNWTLGAYVEKTHKGLLRHINTRFSTTTNEILLTLVLNSDTIPDIKDFTDKITEKFPCIKGVLVNLNPNKTNKITGDKTVLIKGEDFLIQKIGEAEFKIGADSFFQVNPKTAELLFNSAEKLIQNKGCLLDLYGGVGTIGICLKNSATKITLVEENKEAIKLAKENFKLNEVLKYEVFENKAKDRIKEFIKEKRHFENIVIDPPRKGSDKETLDNISKMTDSIIYISCNPMTLKRDAEILIQNGFNFVSIQPVDMFPNTHHIECVAHFKRGLE